MVNLYLRILTTPGTAEGAPNPRFQEFKLTVPKVLGLLVQMEINNGRHSFNHGWTTRTQQQLICKLAVLAKQ